MQFAKPIQLNDTQTLRWMFILLKRARNAGDDGEVPVSAIILNEKGHCIGHGRNTRNRDCNPLGHAELIALRQGFYVFVDQLYQHPITLKCFYHFQLIFFLPHLYFHL